MVWDEIYSEIREARKRSDIFGVVSRMAYFRHHRDKGPSSEENFHRSQGDLAHWCFFQNQETGLYLPVAEDLHEQVGRYAHKWHVNGNLESPVSWYSGLDEFAQQVMHRVKILGKKA